MSELIKLDDIKAPVLYGSDKEVSAVIASLEESARSFVFDMTTAKGRKEVASVAARVASSKTYLDGLGKDFVAGIKAQAKEVDVRRKTIRDSLDSLKEEVRQPLTEFEEIEKGRIAEHESLLANLQTLILDAPLAADLKILSLMTSEGAAIMGRDFEEYTDGADRLYAKLTATLVARAEELQEAIKKDQELAELRKQAEERDRQAHEERIAREAAEEAEAKARVADEARLQAERDAVEAQKRELAAEKQALIDKQQAADLATERERQRIEAEQAAEKQAEEARAANREHRGKINRECVTQLIECGISKTGATEAVRAIAQGRINNITINY
ncbi:MAG: hypothetical protein GY753_09640 [Gammaproteobacteria bacterium]|nr:hypothetical protein [Gammaproteobacteria bacterium]